MFEVTRHYCHDLILILERSNNLSKAKVTREENTMHLQRIPLSKCVCISYCLFCGKETYAVVLIWSLINFEDLFTEIGEKIRNPTHRKPVFSGIFCHFYLLLI